MIDTQWETLKCPHNSALKEIQLKIKAAEKVETCSTQAAQALPFLCQWAADARYLMPRAL